VYGLERASILYKGVGLSLHLATVSGPSPSQKLAVSDR